MYGINPIYRVPDDEVIFPDIPRYSCGDGKPSATDPFHVRLMSAAGMVAAATCETCDAFSRSRSDITHMPGCPHPDGRLCGFTKDGYHAFRAAASSYGVQYPTACGRCDRRFCTEHLARIHPYGVCSGCLAEFDDLSAEELESVRLLTARRVTNFRISPNPPPLTDGYLRRLAEGERKWNP